MKVGIVTVHDSANIGSCLQAIGMQELILAHGDTPVIIETRSKLTTLGVFLGYDRSEPIRSKKRFIRFILKAMLSPKHIFENYKKYLVYKNDWNVFCNTVNVKTLRENDIDILLLGSDEIWNVNQPAFQNPFLYGVNVQAKRKCAYAVSVGNIEEDQLTKFPNLVDGIKNLDVILARDDYSRIVLQKNGIVVNGKICDPTLQVDIRKYMKNVEDINIPENPYIVVYSYAVDKYTVDILKTFAKRKRLKLVAVSLYHSWCDDYINCSPLEFGAILQCASYVYTSTFHGTIFSALYHTKFVVKPFSQKVSDVLKMLELEDCALHNDFVYEDLERILLNDRDYDKTESILLNLKEYSNEMYERYVKSL